jgi:hypothetical protein
MFGFREWLWNKYVARRNAQLLERVRRFEQSKAVEGFDFTQETNGEWRIQVTLKHENVVRLAEEAGDLLEAHGAVNFVQFTMFSAKHTRPMLVTVQYADGLSPVEKLAMVEKELAELKSKGEGSNEPTNQ